MGPKLAESQLTLWDTGDGFGAAESVSDSSSESESSRKKGSKRKVKKKDKSKAKSKKEGSRRPRKTTTGKMSSKYTTWKKTPVRGD